MRDSDEKSSSTTTQRPSIKYRMLKKATKKHNSGSITPSSGGSVSTSGTLVSTASAVLVEPVETISPSQQLLLSSVALIPANPGKSGTTPSSSSSLTGSSSRGKRRTAVLFTKKAAFKEPDMSGSSSPRRTPARPSKTLDSFPDGASVPSASTSTNLFGAAGAAVAAFSIPASTLSLPEPVPQPRSKLIDHLPVLSIPVNLPEENFFFPISRAELSKLIGPVWMMKRSLTEDLDHPVRMLPVDLSAEVVAVIQNQKEVCCLLIQNYYIH